MREHKHLAAVVGFVGKHVNEHGWSGVPGGRPAVAPEFCAASWSGCEGVGEHFGTAFGAFGECGLRLRLCCTRTVEFFRKP